MTTVTVRGASDDLIEVDGAIREEFLYRDLREDQDHGDLLAFSDGTILRVVYTPAGVWRISSVTNGTGSLVVEHAPENDERNYSDRATLGGDIAWVVQGTGYAAAKKPTATHS
jgi:hypothetical protein